MSGKDQSSNYQKYQTGNPLMQRIIGRFLERVAIMAGEIRPNRIVDLGCGEGFVARRISHRLPEVEYRGFDINEQAVKMAAGLNPQYEFKAANILTLPPERNWADLCICLEVLEHLDEPQKAVELIRDWTCGHALISVPREPFFRMGNFLRGKYMGNLGNHPEHIQQFNKTRLRRLLGDYFQKVEIFSCFPWIIGLASK